jgi:hypothetical protein
VAQTPHTTGSKPGKGWMHRQAWCWAHGPRATAPGWLPRCGGQQVPAWMPVEPGGPWTRGTAGQHWATRPQTHRGPPRCRRPTQPPPSRCRHQTAPTPQGPRSPHHCPSVSGGQTEGAGGTPGYPQPPPGRGPGDRPPRGVASRRLPPGTACEPAGTAGSPPSTRQYQGSPQPAAAPQQPRSSTTVARVGGGFKIMGEGVGTGGGGHATWHTHAHTPRPRPCPLQHPRPSPSHPT